MNKHSIIFLIFFLSISLAVADYEFADASFGTVYPQDTYLSGWIDISFDGEPLTSLFTDSLGNTVTLEEALNHSSYIYNCQDNNCQNNYVASNPSTSKNFNLGFGDEALVTMLFTGTLEEINSINFNLSSNAGESNQNQIKIDILDDGIIDTGNTNIGSEIDNYENYGCFYGTEDLKETSIGANTFCQGVLLEEAPGFEIGAWIKKVENDPNINITMTLYDLNGIPLDECLINNNQITTSGNSVFCQINFAVTQEDKYYVCVSSEGEGDYKIVGHVSFNTEKICGFNGIPVKTEVASYKIGAKKINYGAVNEIEISDGLPNGKKISELVEKYIKDTYGSLDCLENNCYVPIKIKSYANQNITLDSIDITYSEVGFPDTKSDKFYDLDLEPAVVNASSQTLYLNNLFKLPSEIGDIDYELKLDDKTIFENTLEIQSVSINLYPLISASNFPITFELNIKPKFNFSKYTWDFGDGIIETSSENKKSHTYSSTGNYTIMVTATTDDDTEFSKSFSVTVDTPENMIASKVDEIKENIETLGKQLLQLESFEKNQFKKRIDLDQIESDLDSIETDLKNVKQESDYKPIIDKLLGIKLPTNIIQASTNSIFYYPQKNNVNLNILESITNGTSGNAEETINSILVWNQNNLNSKISMKEILAKWEDTPETYFKTFTLMINPLYSQDRDFYFVIKDIDGLEFKNNLSIQEFGGYKYLPISQAITIEFATTADLDFLTLPMFISPNLDEVVVEDIVLEEPTNKNVILFIILLTLLIIGFVTYVSLQKWYKYRYERYLFKEINQLYNVATYIHNAKANNVPDSEIRRTLKNAGWNNEQITYALRKYAGKRTGMYEIPIKKLLKNKENELNSEQNHTKFNKGESPK